MVQELNPGHSGKVIVGLTGGFGSGKTTVAHFFEELGAFIVDADRLAHEALMAGSPVYAEIQALFPDALIPNSREFDLKKIAAVIFTDTVRKKQLEAIVHPYVFKRIVEEVADSTEAVAFVEVPLLYETGYERFCNYVAVVTAENAVIAKRLQEKGFSLEEIEARKKAQMPLQEKEARADFIINNSGNFQQTRREVEEIWKKLHPASKGAL